MIIDNTLVLSDHQAVTATAASTNLIDWLAVGLPYGWVTARTVDRGEGYHDIPLLVEVTEVFATLTSLTISVETDDNAAFSSAATTYTTPAIPVATLVAGYRVPIMARIPAGTREQYMRLKYTVTGSNATTGKIFAAVTGGNQTNTW